jgi:dipeptidyl aminopeptidase/acylaminoacyl peptidase
MVGSAGGELWLLDAQTATSRNLTGGFEPRITSIALPAEEARIRGATPQLVVRARQGDQRTLYRVDLWTPGAQLTPLAAPPPGAALVAYHAPSNFAVFTAPQRSDGSFLWTGNLSAGDFNRRLALNTFLAGVADAPRRLITYKTVDGTELRGMLLLPPGYREGQRIPLVTWVYPGYPVQDTVDFWSTKNHPHPDNLNVFAGRGYAVLIPSIPSEAQPRDPLAELTRGVLPAVNRVIEMGIADSTRVGLIGQSAGGYAVYGLVTQTNRFRAAVAMEGYADLVSLYGTFSGQERYRNDAHTVLQHPGSLERDLGAAPWADPDRYVRNSPVFFLDRVRTPLLIIQGDIDYVPIQQGEEVFTSLYRLGKPVRFVRYWGESHGVNSAANIAHRWQEVLRWLDTHLQP